MAETCKIDQIWIPGLNLDADYPVPTPDELAQAWSEYTNRSSRQIGSVYGVYSEVGKISAIASIDLCEVVRETAHSIDIAYGATPSRRSHYKYGTWTENVDHETESNTTIPMVQTFMNAGLVEPDAEIEKIVRIMQNWRNSGILVVANTSTLPGCEIATIEKLMKPHMPESFDALVLPRNHDGTGSMTKAKALHLLAAEIDVDLTELPLVKIDDATHHIDSFYSMFGEHAKAEYFIPRHVNNTEYEKGIKTDTSLEAFKLADEFFRQQGVEL